MGTATERLWAPSMAAMEAAELGQDGASRPFTRVREEGEDGRGEGNREAAVAALGFHRSSAELIQNPSVAKSGRWAMTGARRKMNSAIEKRKKSSNRSLG